MIIILLCGVKMWSECTIIDPTGSKNDKCLMTKHQSKSNIMVLCWVTDKSCAYLWSKYTMINPIWKQNFEYL